MAGNRRFRLWHGLAAIYALLVLIVVAMLAWEQRPEGEPVALLRASRQIEPDQARLVLEGRGLHARLRGVIAETLAADESPHWTVLNNITLRALAVSQEGDLTLVSHRSKLISLSLTGDRAPVVLGSLDFPERIELVRIVGNRALVGMQDHAGIALVDLSDPQQMRVLSILNPSGRPMDMSVNGHLVFVADQSLGIGAIDLAAKDPSLAILATPEVPWRIASAGKRLVVGTLKGAVEFYDIIPPGKLRRTGGLMLAQDVRDLALVGETLAVATSDTLHLYDLSGWPNPLALMTTGLPAPAAKMARVPGRDALVISLVASGLIQVDITRPGLPVVAGHLVSPQTYHEITVREETVLASGYSGLSAFPLEAISGTRSMTSARVSETQQRLFDWNDQVFGYRDKKLTWLAQRPLTTKNPGEPFLAIADLGKAVFYSWADNGRIAMPASPLVQNRVVEDVLWHNEGLYLLDQEGLAVLLGARPEELRPAGSLKLSRNPSRLRLLGTDLLLVATRGYGNAIVDVADPWQPTVVAWLPMLSHLQISQAFQDVLVVDRRAYVSLANGGVHVFDISTPATPRLLQVIQTAGIASSLALHDGLLLIADSLEGVFVVDVSDAKAALPVGSLPTPLRAKQIMVADDGLLVSSHPAGVMKLPLPQRLANLQVANGNEAVAVVEGGMERGLVYLYDAKAHAQVRVQADAD